MAKSESREALRARINAHPILSLAPEARADAQREKTELTRLLLQYYWNGGLGSAHVGDNEPTDAERHETAMRGYLNGDDRAGIGPLDGVAFAAALDGALRGVDPERGTFLAYFYKIYQTHLPGAASGTAYLHGTLSEPDRARVRAHKQVVRWLRARALRFADVDERLYRTIADDLGMDPELVEDVVHFVRSAAQPLSVDAPMSGEDPDSASFAATLADPEGERGYEMIDVLSRYVRVLEQVCDLDMREYPRLFLSNSTLAQAELSRDAETGRVRLAPGAEPVVRLMLECEDLFLRRIFLRSYLDFVLCAPPEPYRMRVILAAERSRKLNDATIALYKQVSKAAVSQQRTRFEKQLAAFRAHLQAQDA